MARKQPAHAGEKKPKQKATKAAPGHRQETRGATPAPAPNDAKKTSKLPQGGPKAPGATVGSPGALGGAGAVPHVKVFPVADLQAAPYNPRQISDAALAGLTRSLEQFGLVAPLIVNVRTKKPRVVGGHQRLKALQARGDKEVLCVTVDVPPAEERLLNITLNNPEIQGAFTADVAQMLEDLRPKVKDQSLLLELRLKELRERVQAEAEKDPFQFRPGETNLKAPKQSGPFWLKKTQIEKFGQYENFILDFSGGRDSTLALLWLATHFHDRNIYPVFSDPGVEFPGMGAHIAQVCAFFDIEPVFVKPKVDFWAWLLAEKQWPSLIFRKCQSVLIHSVTRDFRRQFDKKNTLLLDGSRATQAVRGSKKTKSSALTSLPDYNAYHPCFDVTDEKAAELLEQSGVPLWEGYSRGFVRTACWCCPGQCGLQALALQENYPGLAEDMTRWEKRLGPIRPLEVRADDDGKKKKRGRTFLDVVEAGKRKREQMERHAKKSPSRADKK